MSGPIVTGTKGAYLQPQRYGINESGGYAIMTWEGTRNEVISNIPAILSLGGLYDFEDSFTGAACKLTARFPLQPGVQEAPINTWELFSATSEKDVMEADIGLKLSHSDRDGIRALIEQPRENFSDASVLSIISAGDAFDLYQLMASGVKSVVVNQPTLRHTQTVSNQYAVKASLANVGRIISSATLLNTEGPPSSFLFNLPTISAPTQDGHVKLEYGWLKRYPTVRAAAQQRVQIEQEWAFGLWSQLLYGDVL